MFDVKLSKTITAFVLLLQSLNLSGETIPPSTIKNCKIDNAYTLNSNREIMEKTWQDVCRVLKLPPTDIPNGEFCVNPSGNSIYVQSGDLCADGSFKIPINFGWCNEPVASCPNSSWVLSEDKKTCFRPDDACWKDIENVSEVKLLAAIAYGESHWSNVYEEMAGIASAVIRRRDAARLETVEELVKKNDSFSYVVSNGNERFIKLMCGDEKNFHQAYEAAVNALNYGDDYSNGGCFWDGYDLKTGGVNQYRYKRGFRYSDPSHNIFSAPEPNHTAHKGREKGYYDNVFISTITQGRTIFWKIDEQFIKANGAIQCK